MAISARAASYADHVRSPTAPGIANYRLFMDDATSLVVKYGGSLSGEHGDGQSKAEFLPKMYGAEICEAFREFKSLWDPRGKMNPVRSSIPIQLRIICGRPSLRARGTRDLFSFRERQEQLYACGDALCRHRQCRRQEKGTMCPSYRATMEEKHSTRGRAHLLFEMMHGGVVRDGWRAKRFSMPWTFAFRARDARVIALSMWTWRPTRPSSSRIITRDAYARVMPGRWVGFIAGRGWPRIFLSSPMP